MQSDEATLQACLEHAREHGRLERFPGGVWSVDEASNGNVFSWWFEESTVTILVYRRLLAVTKRGRRGHPSEVRPVEAA